MGVNCFFCQGIEDVPVDDGQSGSNNSQSSSQKTEKVCNCKLAGQVKPKHCEDNNGFQKCPEAEAADVLTDKLARQVISGVQTDLSQAANHMETLYIELWNKTKAMDCPAMFDAIMRHPPGSELSNIGSGAFSKAVKYEVEDDNARKIDACIRSGISAMQSAFERYIQGRPGGSAYCVSSSDFTLLINYTFEESANIRVALQGNSLYGSSHYMDVGRNVLSESSNCVVPQINAMAEEIHQAQMYFEDGVQEFRESAERDTGQVLEDAKLNWNFFDGNR